MRPAGLLIIAAFCVNAASAQAQDYGTLTLNVENDVFTGTDNEYTSGVRAEYSGPEGSVPEFAQPLTRWLAPVAGGDGAEWRPLLGATQLMFTPPDITLPNPPKGERPYAGHLYAYAGLTAETDDRLTVFRVALGATGKPSLAEAAQKVLHGWIDLPNPEGWDTQIGFMPTLTLGLRQTRRAATNETIGGQTFRLELLPHIGFNAGNLDTNVAIGGILRVGQNFGEDFGPTTGMIGASGAGLRKPAEGFGWNLFAGAEGRFIAHAGTIEGPLFDRRHGPDADRVTADLYAGGGLSWGPTTLDYVFVIRSPEYDKEAISDSPRWHRFGSLRLTTRF